MSFHHGTMVPVSIWGKRVCAGCLLLLVLSALTSSPAHSRSWYIKADGTGDAPTIQAGVDSSVAGDVVLVAKGTYEIDLHIRMKGGITVMSESGPYQTKIIPAPATKPLCAFDCFDIDGVGTTEIDGFWIEGFVDYPPWGGPAYGLFLSACGLIYVTNNVITGNGVGIFANINGNVYPRNNTIIGNDLGVELSDAIQVSWNYNIIWDRFDPCLNGWYNNLLDPSDSCLPEVNFSEDPQFCGPSAGNFYLQSDSPCAPGNSVWSELGLIGALPVGCAEVKVETKTWGAIKDFYRE